VPPRQILESVKMIIYRVEIFLENLIPMEKIVVDDMDSENSTIKFSAKYQKYSRVAEYEISVVVKNQFCSSIKVENKTFEYGTFKIYCRDSENPLHIEDKTPEFVKFWEHQYWLAECEVEH